jgi:HlyD family secretion protein
LIGIAGLGLATAAGMGLYHYRPLTIDVLQPESNVAIRVFGLGTVEARLLSKLSF